MMSPLHSVAARAGGPTFSRRTILRGVVAWSSATALLAVPRTVGLAWAGLPAVPSRQVTEIEFLHIHGGVAGEAVDTLARAFNASQSRVRVTPVFVPNSYEGLLEKLQALTAARQLPAVTQSGFTYTKFTIKNLPVTPIQPFMNEEGYDTSDFVPALLRLCQDETGLQWGLPFGVSNPVIYVNLDHYQSAGLDPERDAPRTWAETRRIARLLTTADRMGVYYHYDITGNWLFQAMVECAGGQMSTPDSSRVTFNEEPGVRALSYWSALTNEDATMALLTEAQAQQSFIAGKIGLYVTTIANISPFLKAGLPIRTYLFHTDEEKPRRVPAGGNGVYLTTQSPEQQRAGWEFIKFVGSPEGTTIIAKGIGYMATRRSAVERDDLMGAYLREVPAARTPYDQLNDTVPWYNFPGRGGTRIYKIVQDAIAAALTRQKAPRQALDDAAAEANALLRA